MTKLQTVTDLGPYQLNTVIPGDCLAVLSDFPANCVDLIVTSPPFNVGKDYGLLVDDRRPWDVYYAWLEQVLVEFYRVLKIGGVLALDMPKEIKLPKETISNSGHRVQKMATVADQICLDSGYLPRESIVWVKGVEGMPIASSTKTGSDNNIYLRSVSDIILLYSKERYYVDGGTGRRGLVDNPWKEETKDVWWIPPASSSEHPCPFPWELPRRLIDLFTCPRPGFVPLVCDPFAGTGRVGVVARQMGRNFIGVEINPGWAAQATQAIASTQPVFDRPVVCQVQPGKGNGSPKSVMRLPVGTISVDPVINNRDGLDQSTVDHYAAIFDRLPPMTVYRLPDGTFLLAGGFHRRAAARQLGLAEVEVEVREGTHAEAEEFAVLDNIGHGRPYTRSERRRAARRMLKLHPEWANNRLAAALGMSGHTIEAIRQELEATLQIAKLDSLIGADDKARPRNYADKGGDEAEGASRDGSADTEWEQSGLPVTETASGSGAGTEAEAMDLKIKVHRPGGDDGETSAHPDEPPSPRLRDFPAIPPPSALPEPGVSTLLALLTRLVLLAQANGIRLPLADDSVHCIALSPPYPWQRRYDGEYQVIVWPGVEYAMPGGNVCIPGATDCEHEWDSQTLPARRGSIGDKSTLTNSGAYQAVSRLIEPGETRDGRRNRQRMEISVCARCGAVRCPLGQGPTIEAYVAHIILLLRECARVLRPDGTLWLNLGFCYAGENADPVWQDKNLVPVPWLVAIAAQYDGWYLRSPIAWSKPAAMPSPADDRPTVDYEHILLLTRSARYYYDADAIREPLNEQYAQRRLTPRSSHPKYAGMPPHRRPDYELRSEPAAEGNPLGRNKRTSWDLIAEAARFALELHQAGYELDWALRFATGLDPDEAVAESESLWRINPYQYRGKHYAAWPPALVARIIQAGTPPAVCRRCGAPWQRVKTREIPTYPAVDDPTPDTGRAGFNRPRPGLSMQRAMSVSQAEIAAYLRQSADGKANDCRERYGSKWDHWIRTDDSGARLPAPEDWLDLKAFLGLDGRYDSALLPKNLVVAAGGKRTYRDGGVIRQAWENRDVQSLGWRPDCACFDHEIEPAGDDLQPVCTVCGEAHTAPARVLDVAVGSGTTVQVARILGRAGIGLDISLEYLRDLARERVAQEAKVHVKPDVPPVVRARPLPDNDVILGDVAEILPGLPQALVDLAFWDPPFNLGKQYGSSLDDGQDEALYWEKLRFWLNLILPLLAPGGSLVVHHLPHWAYRIASYLESRALVFRRWVAWQARSTNYAQRDEFRPEHYAFVWFSRGDEHKCRKVLVPHARCARCGDYSTHWGGKEKYRNEAGRRMGDVWLLERTSHSGHKGRKGLNELPLEAVLRWVLALTDPGDYVFDPMIGSGTTAAACELAGRRWGGVELVADNLPIVSAKAAIARGAGQMIGDVATLPAEMRAAIGAELARGWGEGITGPADLLQGIQTILDGSVMNEVESTAWW